MFLAFLYCIQHSQLAVNIKGLVCADFEAADALGTHLCIVDRRIELITPGAAVAVAIAVVVAEQVVAASLFAAADLERLVYGSEEFFFVFGD